MQPYPFTRTLEIMKPCKLDMEKPSHAQRFSECKSSQEYVWEEKIDGIHLNAIRGRFFSIVESRDTGFPGEKTDHLAHMSILLRECVSPHVILDGEAYLPGKKCNDVMRYLGGASERAQKLQSSNKEFVRYRVYDMLRDENGEWLIELPWIERRARLERFFEQNPLGPHIELHPYYECADTDFDAELDRILLSGGEGAVLKHKYSSYYPGKRPMWNWIKVKAEMEDDVVLVRFDPPSRLYTGNDLEGWPYWEDDEPVTRHHAMGWIGTMVVGKYDSTGQLVELGNVTGITDDLRAAMSANPGSYIGTVVKIRAMEKTAAGAYRHANFKEFHQDKNPRECKLQEND